MSLSKRDGIEKMKLWISVIVVHTSHKERSRGSSVPIKDRQTHSPKKQTSFFFCLAPNFLGLRKIFEKKYKIVEVFSSKIIFVNKAQQGGVWGAQAPQVLSRLC